MLCYSKLKKMLGFTLLGLVINISVNGQTLQLWKVEKPIALFYQDASEASRKLETLKPGQAIMILQEEKDWIQLVNLDTKQVGWIKNIKVEPRFTINLKLNKAPHAYSYHMKIQSPEGIKVRKGHIEASSNFNPRDYKRVKNLGKKLSARILGSSTTKQLHTMEDTFDYMMEKLSVSMPVIQVLVSSPESHESYKETTQEFLQAPEKKGSRKDEKVEKIETVTVSERSNLQEG